MDISKLPREMASNSVPCLNKDAFQWGSKSAKEATAGANTEVRATARWSVAEAGEDKRSLILFWAKAPPPTVATEAATADARITDNPNLALAVMVADCIPLLLSSMNIVAAVHVGRAGLVNSIALKTVTRMQELGADSISAMIGPSICGSCYEVPKELHDSVVSLHPAASSRTSSGTFGLDLPAALKVALETVGVAVESKDICTFEDENYYSYRRNQVTGRQVGVIKL